ncbi:MAG: hypothetical protein ACFBWO_01580 [Paracoccaceae bacterium]
MSRSIDWLLVAVMALGAAFPMIHLSFYMYGPRIEAALFPPVWRLEASQRRCEGDDQIVEGRVVKNRGVFRELTVTSGSTRIEWQALDQPSRAPADRPPGETVLGLRLAGNCDRPFSLHTVHDASHDLWSLRQTWGPFNEDDG